MPLQQFSLLTQWQGWGTERLGGALDLQATVSPCPRVALTTSYNLPGPSRTFWDLSEPSRTFSSRADIEQSRGRSAGAERMWRTPCSPCGPVPHISWLPHGLDMPGAGGRQGRQGRGEEAPQLPARTCRRSQLQLVAPGRSQIGAPFKPQLCAFCFQREVHLLCACKMDKTRGTFFYPRPPFSQSGRNLFKNTRCCGRELQWVEVCSDPSFVAMGKVGFFQRVGSACGLLAVRGSPVWVGRLGPLPHSGNLSPSPGVRRWRKRGG